MTVDPMALAPMPPPNMSDRPPPFPLCNSTSTIRISEAEDVQGGGDGGDHGGAPGWDRYPGRGPANTERLDDCPVLAKWQATTGWSTPLDGADLEQRLLLDARRRVDPAVLELALAPAPGAEPAARRRVGRAGHVAGEDDPLARPLASGSGSGMADSSAWVYGWPGFS